MSLIGPQGPAGTNGTDGADGEKWFSGTGAPLSGTGSVGDWYLRLDNGYVYEKTGSSTWTLRTVIMGPAGADGTDGVDGDSMWEETSTSVYLKQGTKNVGVNAGSVPRSKLEVGGVISNGYNQGFGHNSYFDGAWKARSTGSSAMAKVDSNGFTIFIAPSVTQDSNVSFKTFLVGNPTTGDATFYRYVYATNFYHSGSSRKIKKDIRKIGDLKRFDKINIKQFVLKDDPEETVHYGAIAENVKKHAPELTAKGKDDVLTYAPLDLLMAKIARLEERIAELEKDKK
jgi:hypothetical protein